MTETLPPPLLGCLVCHTENTLVLSTSRRVLGGEHPVLTCTNCNSVAQLDWDQVQAEEWRIRYRKIPAVQPYLYAAQRFGKAGWLEADQALDISTEIYIQRQRFQQVMNGDLAWLKPARLSPPPPLMSGDEIVYLALKPASFCQTGRRALFFRPRNDVVLDTGIFYVTNSKVHLLGQRRDRSQRLSEIHRTEYTADQWFVYMDVGGQAHHYQGFSQISGLDAELIVAIIDALRYADSGEG